MSETAFDASKLTPGTKVGPYTLIARIGSGGMGDVWKCERDGRYFAIKFPKPSKLPTGELDARVLREISALAGIIHPNVVHIHSFDRYPDSSGVPYVVMDLVEGDQFYTWLAVQHPTWKQIAFVLQQLGSALVGLHSHEIFHRDLKSENVIVRGDGQPILIDFGIARQRSAYTLTMSKTLVGTSSHLSPEYCRHLLAGFGAKGERYTFRPTDDLHALGYMLYEGLTGRPPFVGAQHEWALFELIANFVPPNPRSLSSQVPEALDAICMKLLAKEAANRFQTGKELADAVDAAIRGADSSWDAAIRSVGQLAVPVAPQQPRPEKLELTADERSPKNEDGIEELLLVPAPAQAAAEPSAREAVPEVAKPVTIQLPTAVKRAFVGEPVAPAVEASPQQNGAIPIPSEIRHARDQLRRRPGASNKHLAIIGLLIAVLCMGTVAVVSAWPTPPSPTRTLLMADAPPAPNTMSAVLPESSAEPLNPGPTATPPTTPKSDPVPNPTASTGVATKAPAPSKNVSGGRSRKPSVRAAATPATTNDKDAPAPDAVAWNMATSSIVSSSDEPEAPAGNCKVTKGALIPAKLTAPANPGNPGPVSAETTGELKGVGGCVAIPKGSAVVCSTEGGRDGRAIVSCDSITLARGAVAFRGTAVGKDKQPGLPVHRSGGTEAPSTGGSIAGDVAQRVANQVLPGAGVVGALGSDAVGVASTAASRGSYQAESLSPAPKGTAFFVFVQEGVAL